MISAERIGSVERGDGVADRKRDGEFLRSLFRDMPAATRSTHVLAIGRTCERAVRPLKASSRCAVGGDERDDVGMIDTSQITSSGQYLQTARGSNHSQYKTGNYTVLRSPGLA
jgi:hypothetical protein